MKTTFKVVIAALTLSTFVFDGCKKGPDDPFMSLHSRKGRMTGDWTVKTGSGSYGTSSATTTWTFDGTTYTATDASGSSSNGWSMTLNFEKDGTYKSVTTQTFTIASVTSTDVTTETGTWNFTGKIGDDKNKDHVVMKTLVSTDVQTTGSSSSTTTDTYTGDDAPVNIMYIDELKNKEIIFTWDGTYVSGSNNSFNKGTYTLAQ